MIYEDLERLFISAIEDCKSEFKEEYPPQNTKIK